MSNRAKNSSFWALISPLMAINREVDCRRMRVSPGCHSMIELNDHLGVEKLAQGHERLQGVAPHKPHRVSDLMKGSKS